MSKMSQLHAELEEQAVEKGYESLDHFLECGGEVDMVHGKLVNSASELEKAHEAWLEEREEVLEELKNLHEYFVEDDDLHYSIVVAKAIKLLEEGEY